MGCVQDHRWCYHTLLTHPGKEVIFITFAITKGVI